MVSAKNIKAWVNTIFMMAFYVGLFSVFGYLIQLTLF
jgi:hypothetical protein